MKEIPIKKFPRQSLSVVLEGSLYELSLKECNGIMAVTVVRDGVTIVSNRRAVAGVPVIPAEYLEQGNFLIATTGEELPYYTGFEGSDAFIYLTSEELEDVRSGQNYSLPAGSIPSGPLVDFNYLSGTLAYGMALARSTTGTYIQAGVLKTASVNVARFEDKGLLIEDTSTNQLIYSSNLAQSTWTKARCTATANVITISADGYTSVIQTKNVSLTDYLTFSVDAEITSPELDQVYIQLFAPTASIGARVNLNTGDTAPSANNPIAVRARKLANGYRLSITIDAAKAANITQFQIFPSSSTLGTGTGQSNMTGATGKTLKVTNVQAETSQIPTSYIPTTTAVSSRSADVLSLTQPGAKTVYREYMPLGAKDIVKELVRYTGELCPPGHLQKLKAWNRDLTAAEIKALGVVNV